MDSSIWRNWILPTAANNYCAYLLKKSVLLLLIVLLLTLNVLDSQLGIGHAQAAVSAEGIFLAHNEQRLNFGLPGLRYSPVLASSAKAKADAMLASNCWSHYCPNGKSPWDFFKDAGYNYLNAGENLAEGFHNVSGVIKAWMDSPTHRENILKSQFTEVGVGFASGTYQGARNNMVIVVHFGKPRVETIPSLPNTGDPENATGELRIDFPANGSSIPDESPTIRGSGAQTDVDLDLDANRLGRISPEGGLFTVAIPQPLSEGEHLLTASESGSGRIANSRFTVDITAPVIDTNNLKVQRALSSELLDLHYHSTEKLAALALVSQTAEPNVSGTSSDGLSWLLRWEARELKGDLLLSASDAAGNITTEALPLEQVNRLSAQANAILNPSTASGGSIQWIQILTIGFVLFYLLLLVLDHFEINRLNSLRHLQLRSRAQMRLPLVLVLLLVIALGNLQAKI